MSVLVSPSPLLERRLPLVAFIFLIQGPFQVISFAPVICDAIVSTKPCKLDHGSQRSARGSIRNRLGTACTSALFAESATDSVGNGDAGGGIYRPFAEYAWSRLKDTGLFEDGEATPGVPKELASNTSPARGMAEGTDVNIEVRSMAGKQSVSPVRLARYALLETLAPAMSANDNRVAVPDAIHVLNLVAFPDHNLTGCSALPVLGLDLVTLPGSKHLIAIDFQPVLPLPAPSSGGDGDNKESEEGKVKRIILPEQYAEFEGRLADLHRKHCVDSDALPWGGDIPEFAKRFFSPHAVWTRLAGEEALDVVQNEVMSVFCDYVDLYADLMQRIQGDIESGTLILNSGNGNPDAVQGQTEYLNYRRDNDPARPMLKSLYGEEWTEKLIAGILFRNIK